MGLRARIIAGPPDRRTVEVTPIIERRAEPSLPEWRRRALEQRDRVGYIAVADLTRERVA